MYVSHPLYAFTNNNISGLEYVFNWLLDVFDVNNAVYSLRGHYHVTSYASMRISIKTNNHRIHLAFKGVPTLADHAT